ncbi:MAG: ACT domain-containing protein, partial [Opitutales bacterium]|nr:ACT domain-containing protein [Opitutales bacterium]
GASTKEAQESCGIEVAELIGAAVKDGVIKNAINAPSVNADTLAAVKPYVSLCEQLGTLIQQIAPAKISRICVSYFGKLAQLDNKLLTLSLQKGFLRRIADNANDVNSPSKLKHLGVEIEAVNSSADSEYSELVEVKTTSEDGQNFSVAGTVMGRGLLPRIVRINGTDVEIGAKNSVLLLINKDKPGMIGTIATILGSKGCNIANMTVSRLGGDEALSVYELDEHPSNEVAEEISKLDAVANVKVVDFS